MTNITYSHKIATKSQGALTEIYVKDGSRLSKKSDKQLKNYFRWHVNMHKTLRAMKKGTTEVSYNDDVIIRYNQASKKDIKKAGPRISHWWSFFFKRLFGGLKVKKLERSNKPIAKGKGNGIPTEIKTTQANLTKLENRIKQQLQENIDTKLYEELSHNNQKFRLDNKKNIPEWVHKIKDMEKVYLNHFEKLKNKNNDKLKIETNTLLGKIQVHYQVLENTYKPSGNKVKELLPQLEKSHKLINEYKALTQELKNENIYKKIKTQNILSMEKNSLYSQYHYNAECFLEILEETVKELEELPTMADFKKLPEID